MLDVVILDVHINNFRHRPADAFVTEKTEMEICKTPDGDQKNEQPCMKNKCPTLSLEYQGSSESYYCIILKGCFTL